jgi:hypothetical protein
MGARAALEPAARAALALARARMAGAEINAGSRASVSPAASQRSPGADTPSTAVHTRLPKRRPCSRGARRELLAPDSSYGTPRHSRTRANTVRVSDQRPRLCVECEAAGRRLFREVKERERRCVRSAHRSADRRGPLARANQWHSKRGRRGDVRKQLATPPAKKSSGMALLLLGVSQEQAAQRRIARPLGGASKSRPPLASVSAKRRSLRARRCASAQIRQCSGGRQIEVDGTAPSKTLARRAALPATVDRALDAARAERAAVRLRRGGDGAWFDRHVVLPALYPPPPAWTLPRSGSRRGAGLSGACGSRPGGVPRRVLWRESPCRWRWPCARRSWRSACSTGGCRCPGHASKRASPRPTRGPAGRSFPGVR